eukprot:gene11330-4142_t
MFDKKTRKYTVTCEGGDRKRGGVKISESPVIKTKFENIENEKLNMDKVQVQFGKEMNEYPLFLIRGLDFIKEKGIKSEGIFRIAAAKTDLLKIKDKLNSKETIDFSQIEKKYGIEIISDLVKLFLRELPEPICTFECYDMFLAVTKNKEEKERKLLLKKVLNYLPSSNKKILSHLCLTLHEISQNSKINKMTTTNLAVVFSPNILSHVNISFANVVVELKQSQDVVELLIREAAYYFIKARDTSTEYDEIDDKITGESPIEVAAKVFRYSMRYTKDAEKAEKEYYKKISIRNKSMITTREQEEIENKRKTYLSKEYPDLKIN